MVVCAVSVEPVSCIVIPDLQGKNREFASIRAVQGDRRPLHPAGTTGFSTDFPTRWNREFLSSEQGNFHDVQGT